MSLNASLPTFCPTGTVALAANAPSATVARTTKPATSRRMAQCFMASSCGERRSLRAERFDSTRGNRPSLWEQADFPRPPAPNSPQKPARGAKTATIAAPPDRPPPKILGKTPTPRFFWFFCGVKKGPPHHRKIDATTEKWALRWREEGVDKNPEVRSDSWGPTSVLSFTGAVKLIVNDLRFQVIIVLKGMREPCKGSNCLRRASCLRRAQSSRQLAILHSLAPIIRQKIGKLATRLSSPKSGCPTPVTCLLHDRLSIRHLERCAAMRAIDRLARSQLRHNRSAAIGTNYFVRAGRRRGGRFSS